MLIRFSTNRHYHPNRTTTAKRVPRRLSCWIISAVAAATFANWETYEEGNWQEEVLG